jgi:hypothetical protein
VLHNAVVTWNALLHMHASLGQMVGERLFQCRRSCAIRHFRQRFNKLSFRTEEVVEFVYIAALGS